MDAIQQYLLDTYRTARLGDPPPPPPGRHDREVLRELGRRARDAPGGPQDRPGPR